MSERSIEEPGWFGTRCIFALDGDEGPLYEERITIWRASGPDGAIELAEAEAAEYVETVGGEYLGLAQVYTMDGVRRPAVRCSR